MLLYALDIYICLFIHLIILLINFLFCILLFSYIIIIIIIIIKVRGGRKIDFSGNNFNAKKKILGKKFCEKNFPLTPLHPS